ncbi:response regulator [Gynurincola endophyticus]|jgi:CheY-like chemotaxis protein|uniref:response regulator n=1 Tax=Gynurincola endophyticus TaxID=2479004 RepID=UPI000F8F5AE8|nr:response regulator [Gynurincola endophyticus]
MKNKLKRILLIDDDESSNYLHRIIIKQAEVAEEIETMTRADKAIDYLKDLNSSRPDDLPDLVFLDINMPAMNGWDFLNAYAELDLENKEKLKIVMLTASVNPNDVLRARTNVFVSEIFHKPLSVEAVMEKLPGLFP